MRFRLSVLAMAVLLPTWASPGPATAIPDVVSLFDPGLGLLVGIAVDPIGGGLFVYPDFDPSIYEFGTDGSQVPPPIPMAGAASNDMDLDFAPEALTINGVSVPAGTLLVVNGESAPFRLYGLDRNDGTVLAQVDLAIQNNPVGGSYHPERNTVFVVEWASDQIKEIDPASGAVVATFPVSPSGSPVFDVYYGDVSVGPDGNLFVVSSAQSEIRELTPTGSWVADYDIGFLEVSQMSGLDFDPTSGDVWVVTTVGEIARVSNLSQGLLPQDASVAEPAGSTTTLDFTVSLVATTPATVQIAYATRDGTATAGRDYVAASGTLTFAPGESSKTVSVTVSPDAIVEAEESVILALSDPSGAIAGAQATGLILDDDEASNPGCTDADQICGSPGADVIEGTSAAETIAAGGGDDEVAGGGGNDLILGEGGDDILKGDGGRDVLKGGPGRDVLDGGKGRDKCVITKGEKTKGCERVVTKRHR